MDEKRIGVLAALVTVFSVLVQYVPSIILLGWGDGGFPRWLPTMDTMGQTVWLYQTIARVVTAILIALVTVGLGYHVGRRIDLDNEYRRFIGLVTLGSVFALVAGLGLLGVAGLVMNGPPTLDGMFVLQPVGMFLRVLVNISLPVVLGTFAGAALAHFKTDPESPHRPADTTDDPPSPISDSQSTSTDNGTQPTR